jgi:hypothetical protein
MNEKKTGAINIFYVLCAAESPGALWPSLKDSAEQDCGLKSHSTKTTDKYPSKHEWVL